MPKTMWVKNVYNLLTRGVQTSAKSYTGVQSSVQQDYQTRVKPQYFAQTMNTFPPISYTAIFSSLPQEKRQLYTLSTAPIIKKMNKK